MLSPIRRPRLFAASTVTLCVLSLAVVVPAQASVRASATGARPLSSCTLTSPVTVGAQVTATANWVKDDCAITDGSLTVRLYQNGVVVSKKTVNVPTNAPKVSVSASAKCVVGDSYQAKAKLTANQGPVSAHSTVVTAKTC